MKASKARRTTRTRSTGKIDLLKREKAIIADIRAGKLSYREIAHKHGVSLPTVNNKARKAGISRGRRKGARIVVAGPARKKAVRKVARKAKKAVRKVARKAVRKPVAAAAPVARLSRPRKVARKRSKRVVRQASHSTFCADLRELLLKYNPNISLRRYEKIAKLVELAVR